MEKQEWLNNVLNSTQGIQRAEAPDSLWVKIQQELKNEVKVIAMVPRRTVWLAAASVALLILLNLVAVRSYHPTQKMTALEALMAEYQLSAENLSMP
ncbi:MAG: hypothetical protein MUE30_19325 [Spirosomaceae bacterium]|jgi:hypothetical protein|nr:hypothetical protein [Spirosomataceae bacterium]